MIEIRVNELLNGRTFYWLAKQTSISHSTLWRLKKRKALGIHFATLEKLCQALKCQPGDVLSIPGAKEAPGGAAQREHRKTTIRRHEPRDLKLGAHVKI